MSSQTKNPCHNGCVFHQLGGNSACSEDVITEMVGVTGVDWARPLDGPDEPAVGQVVEALADATG